MFDPEEKAALMKFVVASAQALITKGFQPVLVVGVEPERAEVSACTYAGIDPAFLQAVAEVLLNGKRVKQILTVNLETGTVRVEPWEERN